MDALCKELSVLLLNHCTTDFDIFIQLESAVLQYFLEVARNMEVTGLERWEMVQHLPAHGKVLLGAPQQECMLMVMSGFLNSSTRDPLMLKKTVWAFL
jgi:hypothetical protein